MNERIKELAEQSEITQYVAAHNKYLERFAKLIVRECVGLVNEQLQHNNPNDSLLALKIKEHFGVSE